MYGKNRVFVNLIWRFLERCGAQGVRFLVELVLARLLMPDDYGVIALVTVLIELLNVLMDSGLGNALIQKKDADELDFSSVFYFNSFFCLFLYGLLFAGAPFVAGFFRRPELTSIIRVLGIQVIISGVKNVQQAYVSKTMQFKRFFFATLGGTIGAAVVGIGMAYCGFGVWALVVQQLFNTLVDTFILWITVKWYPKKMFSWKRLGGLLGFGWKLLISALLDKGYKYLRQLIIGRMYTSEDLAYYNRGQQFPLFFVSTLNNAIDSVLLPTMADVQDDTVRVKEMTRRSIMISTYTLAPLMMGLGFIAEPFVSFILTDKWLPCVPFLRICCITCMFYPIHTANLNAIKAMGRSDLFLRLEILKTFTGVVLLLSTIRFGVMAMAYSGLVSSVLSQIINSWPNKKLLDYSYIEQLKDILPNILLAIGMGMIVWCVYLLKLPELLTLIIQVVLGAVIYIMGSVVFRIDSFTYLWGILKSSILSKR